MKVEGISRLGLFVMFSVFFSAGFTRFLLIYCKKYKIEGIRFQFLKLAELKVYTQHTFNHYFCTIFLVLKGRYKLTNLKFFMGPPSIVSIFRHYILGDT